MNILRFCVLLALLLPLGPVHADTAGDVEMLLRQIRMGQKLPAQSTWLKQLPPLDPGVLNWRGRLRGIDVTVETYQKNGKVFSGRIEVPGNRTRELLPAVIAVHGPAGPSEPNSDYSWRRKEHCAYFLSYNASDKRTVITFTLEWRETPDPGH